jgi:peptidoglycan/xylan/chitin deacetylase (PgdA/CDA1 family)
MRRRVTCALIASAAAAIGFASAPIRAQSTRGVPVLMYHKVDAPPPQNAVGLSLTLDPAQFEAQAAWLHDRRIATITAQALVEQLASGKAPSHTIVLTFDDGYEDAYTHVFPILRKYGERASFYVSADLIGTPHHLSWKELREMAAGGMEIACHGSRHLDLTTLDSAGKRYEIEHCAAALKKWMGIAPRTYVYAAGRYDPAAVAIVRAAGFEAAFTEHPGLAGPASAPFELPRRRVDRGDSLQTFASTATP